MTNRPTGPTDSIDPLAPATPDEQEAARRLAEALEGRGAADAEALAAARLLQSSSASEDDLGARRLRTKLVAAAARRGARLFARGLAAAAALLVAAGLVALLTRHRDVAPTTSTARLDQREAEAKAALARLLVTEEGPVETLTSSLASTRFADRVDSLRESRLTRLGASSIFPTSAGSSSRSPEPTLGGQS
jgi:hypothetical protein